MISNNKNVKVKDNTNLINVHYYEQQKLYACTCTLCWCSIARFPISVQTVYLWTEAGWIMRVRHWQRINELNKGFVLGERATKIIKVPGILNDYNHWMFGVDITDGLIASYRPKIRCRQTWMPIMLHCFDILHVNCYILYHTTLFEHK